MIQRKPPGRYRFESTVQVVYIEGDEDEPSSPETGWYVFAEGGELEEYMTGPFDNRDDAWRHALAELEDGLLSALREEP